MFTAKRRPFCTGLNVLKKGQQILSKVSNLGHKKKTLMSSPLGKKNDLIFSGPSTDSES